MNTSKSYNILIERGCLSQIGERACSIFKPGSKVMVISDTNVFPLYGEQIIQSLTGGGFSCCSFQFPAGESSKQLGTIEAMYQALTENSFTRSDFIVALGGGVTGDMAGFAAATFLRGIGFIQVPTSLLAQIDSSVGGKTGVDLPAGKNLVGAFHQPRLVLIDPDTLSSLPPRYFADGMGEAIKYGCIKDSGLFHMILEENIQDKLEEMIFRCVDIKRVVVEHDEFDTGERMLLNFGHTFGHALEKLYHFQKLSHGEAVGIGMVMMTEYGEAAGITKKGTAAKIRKALKKYGLPTEDTAETEKVLSATALDKKGIGSNIRVVLLKEIGEAFVEEMPRTRLAELAGVAQ